MRNGVASARIFPNPEQARTPQASRLAADPRRRLLRAKERLPLAVVTEGFPALEDRLGLVQEVAPRWNVGASERRVTRAPKAPAWQGSEP